jgi:hypothetical protein
MQNADTPEQKAWDKFAEKYPNAEYVSFHSFDGCAKATLDGDFTIEELSYVVELLNWINTERANICKQ